MPRQRLQWASVRTAMTRARYAPLMENLPRLGLAAVLLYGGWLAIEGEITVGAIVAFNAYVIMLQAPFRLLGMITMLGQRAAASAARIYEILDEAPEIVDRPGAVDLVAPRGEIEFDDVTFAYRRPGAEHDEPVLEHFSLRLRARRDGRHRGPHRQREVDDRAAAAPLLRRRQRVGTRRRQRRARPHARKPAGERRGRARRAVPVLDDDPREHRLLPSRRLA